MLGRLTHSLNLIFPLRSILSSIMVSLVVQLVYLRLSKLPPGFELKLIFPAIVVTLVLLLLRLIDELHTDARIPKKDILLLTSLSTAGIFLFSLRSFHLFFSSIIILIYCFLIFKSFFIEEKKIMKFPLILISHHPIFLLNFIYLIYACIDFYTGAQGNGGMWVLPMCLIFTNWEISRKIREPGKENEDFTYSKIWGARKATKIALVIQAVFIFSLLQIFSNLDTPYILRIAFVICEIVLLWPYYKFGKTLIMKGSLKQNSETQMFAILGFMLVAAFL